jgi:glucosyl-3-phosphoglycerate synthase
MACQIMLTAWSRLEREGRLVATERPAEHMMQFTHLGDRRQVLVGDVGVRERPPLITVPEYAGYARPAARWRAR